MYRVYTAHKTGKQQLRIRCGENEWQVTTNNYGFFQLNGKQIKEGERITYYMNGGEQPVSIFSFEDEFYYADPKKLGVISDIDDTILHTNATNVVKKLRQTVGKTVHKRKNVIHMNDLYQQLQYLGAEFYYVSNSEMNLYYLIHHFLENKNFPLGPIYLKPLRRLNHLLYKRSKKVAKYLHKIEKIRKLLDLYPDKPYLFIGDSGQQDAYVYTHLAREYPEQVKGVYIRDIGKRIDFKEYERYRKQLEQLGIPFEVFDSARDIIGTLTKCASVWQQDLLDEGKGND
ncbi:hypothetical protein GCM10023331_05540 [Algivirga pacifica]|uniref:Phosphatidate phosphatase APP1 catalytic domain-containing protein n=2 Tax=Algivirga pacifica TaxID=1162670 RepID=A0ABP9D0U2_9BACT